MIEQKLVKNNESLTPEEINMLIENQGLRKALVKESHTLFFHLYFYEYTKYKTAPFQREMFKLTEDENLPLTIVIAFRGSAKSTIMTLSYPIWSILGKQQKKCVLIVSQTQSQVRTHFLNIKRELESNKFLGMDLGPFQENSEEWASFSLFLPKFNARIISASSEQSIRGLRHGANRPDLIICDDIEDLSSTRTKERRDKSYSWFTSEIIPLGEKHTKIVVVGNLLHEDSVLMRLMRNIDNNKLDGIYKNIQ